MTLLSRIFKQSLRESLLAAVIAIATIASASASYVVDTGPGPNDVDISITPSARYASGQYLAANFFLSSTATITGIEGWMSVIPGGSGSGRLALYSDGVGVPGLLLFAESFFAPVTDFAEPAYSHAEWLGSLTLAWQLAAGSYWVAFEADQGGVVAGFLLGSPNQLGMEAFSQGSGQPWIRNDGLGLGVRVSGNVAEPSTLPLLLGALLLAAATRFGKSKR